MRLLYDSHAYAYHHHADDHVGGEDLLRRFREIYALVVDNGVLYQKTDVIDTFVFRTLRTAGNPSQAMALSLFLMRNYMREIPPSLMESVKLDGANDGQGVFGRPAQKL